jgi:hypothetical protein
MDLDGGGGAGTRSAVPGCDGSWLGSVVPVVVVALSALAVIGVDSVSWLDVSVDGPGCSSPNMSWARERPPPADLVTRIFYAAIFYLKLEFSVLKLDFSTLKLDFFFLEFIFLS